MVEIYFALMILVILLLCVGVVKFYRALNRMEKLSGRFKSLIETDFVKKNMTTCLVLIGNWQIKLSIK